MLKITLQGIYQNIAMYIDYVIIDFTEDAACPPTSQHAYQGPVLKVSAFNIQIFGRSKFKKKEVVTTLVQVSQHLPTTLSIVFWCSLYVYVPLASFPGSPVLDPIPVQGSLGMRLTLQEYIYLNNEGLRTRVV